MKCKNLVLFGTAALLVLASTSGFARQEQNTPYYGPTAFGGNGTDNPDWVEEEAPPPPAFSVNRLIAIEMPPFVTVKVGVDPETISVGADGVVRYVIVMRNATGSSNAVYEGIRCMSDEVKTYARQSSSGEWSLTKAPQWKALNDNMPSQYAKAFARQGGCQNRLATSKREIIEVLKTGLKPGQSIKRN